MTLSFAPFRRDAELDEQRILFSECFPENKGLPPETKAFYLRKFDAFPAEPRSFEYVARDEKGMAGYYAAIPYSYLIDGEVMRCGMVCDVMTAVRLRGQGVFTKLGAYSLVELEKAGIDFVTGYPRRASVIPGHLKVGWKIAFRLPLYIMPVRTNALLSSRKLGFLAPLANTALAVMKAGLSLVTPRDRRIQTRGGNWQEFLAQDDYAAFLLRWRERRRNTLNKDRSYLEWRLSIRGVDYKVVTASRESELVGVSILRTCEPENVPSLGILDSMCVDDDPHTLAAMAREWRRFAAQTGCELILVMMSEFRARQRQLWRLGFLKSPTVFSLIVKCFSRRARDKVLPDPAHWDLMWIDSDDL